MARLALDGKRRDFRQRASVSPSSTGVARLLYSYCLSSMTGAVNDMGNVPEPGVMNVPSLGSRKLILA